MPARLAKKCRRASSTDFENFDDEANYPIENCSLQKLSRAATRVTLEPMIAADGCPRWASAPSAYVPYVTPRRNSGFLGSDHRSAGAAPGQSKPQFRNWSEPVMPNPFRVA